MLIVGCLLRKRLGALMRLSGHVLLIFIRAFNLTARKPTPITKVVFFSGEIWGKRCGEARLALWMRGRVRRRFLARVVSESFSGSMPFSLLSFSKCFRTRLSIP